MINKSTSKGNVTYTLPKNRETIPVRAIVTKRTQKIRKQPPKVLVM